MSLKDLFQVKKVLPPVSNEQIAEEIESVQLIDSYSKDKNRVQFAVDYATASNFSIFGSAEKYYNDSIQRIYSQYPYDGSKKEKLDWYNSSSLLDIWFLENVYPKTTGYATFSPSGWSSRIGSQVSGYGEPTSKEYIIIKGGPNTNSASTLKGQFADTSNQYPKSNILDSATNRLSNLQTDLNDGVTLEFWLNKSSFITSSTEKEVIFDLWNNEVSSSNGYGRLTLELSGTSGSPFYITAQSGTSGVYRQNVGSTPTTSSVTSGWNHYAISLINSSSAISAKFYVNGELDSTHSFGTSINDITGSLIANIGALRTAPSGTTGISTGWGKLSGSLDDFRFWKTKRTSREIGRNWWTTIGGGTNTDDANTDLGFYFKFNEGITTTSSIDSIVLDYSGRVSNGTWIGYTSASRNTNSAMTDEAADPIIYSTHPDVVAILEEYSVLGKDHDINNPNTIYYSFPNWIVEEDTNQELLNLTQIAASYLDTLYLQIKFFNTIKDQYTNIQIDEKPYPFSRTILESMGIVAPSLFIDAKLVEEVLSRDDERTYEDKLDEIKNVIYQNIYSNLSNILKSKGNEKAYRNLLHCFGIDESLVKLNIYSNNGFYKVEDNFVDTTTKKKSINLNDPDRFESTIYQYKYSTNSNSYSYFSSSTDYDFVPLTYEVGVVFPKKLENNHPSYFNTNFLTSSIFGAHSAVSDPDDLTWAANDYFNFQVFSARTEIDGKDVKFILSSSNSAIPTLTSSLYTDVYNNEKWNFAVKITPDKQINVDVVSGTTNSSYTLEFYGVNTDGNVVKNEFTLTSSLSNTDALNIIRQSRRVYFGAEKTNFTGSTIKQTDLKLLGLRCWVSSLSHDDIKLHSYNPNSYGVTSTYENTYLNLFDNINIPKEATLIMDWQFATVTGSDSGVLLNAHDGKFVVEDTTSGSLDYSRYNNQINNLKKYQFTGRGDFFSQNDNTIIDTQYLFSSKLIEFENLRNSNLINISGDEEQTFTRQTRPINYFFSFEKSMYQTISEEMLNMFGTILDFNNLVGDPVNKYRKSYKDLNSLKGMFFEKVQNEPDLDRYLDFYKWIDSAVGKFFLQLTPASANTSDGLLNVIESHALERNKYQHKFPTIEFKLPIIEAGAQSINKHLYDWNIGHRPLSNNENDNCLYWNKKAERDVIPLSSSNSGVNETRKQILNVSLQALNRSFTTPYRFKVDEHKSIQGGINFDNNKNLEFATIAVAPHGPMDADDTINVPANYLFAGIENTSSLIQDCNDVRDPNKKVKYHFTTVHGRDYLSSSLSYGEVLNSKIALPANFVSGNVTTGYQSQVSSEFMNGVVITNIHNDTYGSRNEVPVQGPFTNQWVGGRQSRHVPLNQGTDTYTNRPEAWKILMGTGSFSGSYQTAIGFVGADYPFPEGNPDSPSYPVRAHLRATYLREETAKRIVNFKNIRNSTGSLNIGNYDRNYQVVHSVGSTTNNRALLDAVNPTVNNELAGIVRTDVTNGRIDYELPTRQRSETIIINRFSAPGDYRTMSRGYLNNYAEELSPYNVLPFRNQQLIGDGRLALERLIQLSQDTNIDIISGSHLTLNQLQSIPSDKGYMYWGLYPTEALWTFNEEPHVLVSIHKANKNRIVVFTNQTKNINDNGFVTHQIPQKDSGYSWITASLSQSSNIKDADYGYLDNIYTNGVTVTYSSGSSSTIRNLQAVSSSDYGSVIYGSARIIGPSSSPRTDLIPFDFVGLNTNIYASSSYTTVESTQYAQLTGGLITSYLDTDAPYYFNGLLLKRNGPYGYPTFKQIRNSYNPIVRKLNNENYISVFSNNEFTIEKEPTVYFNSPAKARIKDIVNDKQHYFTYTYENLKQGIENPAIYNTLSNRTENKTFYNKKIKFLLNNKDYKFLDMSFDTSIYPQKKVKSLLSTRKRTYYTFSAWRNDRNNRTVYNQRSLFDVRGDTIPTQSVWPMDNAINGTSSLTNSVGGEGVLQNAYSSVHYGSYQRITSSVLYAHKHMNTSIESYKNKQAISSILPFSQSNTQIDTTNGLFDGTTKWQTADNISGPYEDNYDIWFDKIRTIAKDYSIIPEFIISDDQKILSVQKNDLNNIYLNSLSLTGSAILDATGSEFLNVYVKADQINGITKLKEDLLPVTDKIKLTLNCNAIIKFNPKPELYPQIQTVKIADKFANSIKDFTKFWVTNQSASAAVSPKFRTLMTPMFAPGILYNTIKSGIAVDYPILTSSLTVSASYYNSINTIPNFEIANHYFDKRLPFETLVEPENYLTTDIIDMEPHPSASLNITGSWTGQYTDNLYKFAINNFLAESINFFLPDGKLTTIFSKPETQFKEVDPNLEYRALVRIYKTADNIDYYNSAYEVISLDVADRMSYTRPDYPWDAVENITMYSRPTAFGPPCFGGSGSILDATEFTDLTLGTSKGLNPAFTPPYYDGSSWALLTFKPSGSVKYKPTLQEIINNLSSSYVRFDRVLDLVDNNDGPYHSSRVNSNSMQVSASLNLFNIVNTQDISLDNTDSSLIENGSKVWAIQTKFETPILNFDPSQTGIIIESGSKVPTIGMWHQFGQLPSNDKGIYLQIMDIPKSYILKGFEGDSVSAKSINPVPQLTASLTDIVGFNKTPTKLGQVASTKQIKEAVIAIPYTVDKNNNIQHIKLNSNAVAYIKNQFFGKNLQTQTQQSLTNQSVNDTIKSQIDKMKSYVIPPKYDFINNENIDPIAMYIFEFSYNLTQDDLIKIWQGVQPNISVEFDKQNQTIEHILEPNEMLDSDLLTDRLQWLVFKVKQKASNNYYEKVITSIQEKEKKRVNNLLKLGRKNTDDSIKQDVNLTYSYNWPYDFFSLVELAKIEATVEFTNNSDSPKELNTLSNSTLGILNSNKEQIISTFEPETIQIKTTTPIIKQATNLGDALKIKKATKIGN